MISNEQFVERVLDNFDKINDKIDKLHGETGEEIKEICDELRKTQKQISDHLLENKVIDEINEKALKKRDRKFYIIMAIMGAAFTIYEFTKDLI